MQFAPRHLTNYLGILNLHYIPRMTSLELAKPRIMYVVVMVSVSYKFGKGRGKEGVYTARLYGAGL